MQIITHRWLDPLNNNFLHLESSKWAFLSHLESGYWIEFDINFTKDLYCFISHNKSLTNYSNSNFKEILTEITKNKLESIAYKYNTLKDIIWLDEVLKYINIYRIEWEYSALHLKWDFQNYKYIDIILSILWKHKGIDKKVFIFDVKPEFTKYIKSKNSQIQVFASCSHPYDIKRFNKYVGFTLLNIEEIFNYSNLYDWIRFDERDRKNINWKKQLYTYDIINKSRQKWYKTAIVSPELHAKSPWLLANEYHEDCLDDLSYSISMHNIIKCNPDFICTDYISLYSNYISKWVSEI